MRNISPQDAKTTSEVLDRVLALRRDLDFPTTQSVFTILYCVTTIKKLLAIYQPQIPASFYLIQEGKRSKGGLNTSPSTPRPEPPKAQSVKWKERGFL